MQATYMGSNCNCVASMPPKIFPERGETGRSETSETGFSPSKNDVHNH